MNDLVGMLLDEVAFLRYNVLIAEEMSSLVMLLKGRTMFLSLMCYFIVILLERLS